LTLTNIKIKTNHAKSKIFLPKDLIERAFQREKLKYRPQMTSGEVSIVLQSIHHNKPHRLKVANLAT
jgi:hypothetical protein